MLVPVWLAVPAPLTQESYLFFFFNDTATTEIYTLSLHDALPISFERTSGGATPSEAPWIVALVALLAWRSEEHTSELQSQSNLVCRLLLEKKKTHPHCPVTRNTSTAQSTLYPRTQSLPLRLRAHC